MSSWSPTRSIGDSLTLSLSGESDEMHRSYQSILPCQNKLLQKRWDKTYYDEHRRKVANVTPMVDTRAPQTFMHLHLKLKKLQIEEDRLDIIERDNRILLEKMAYIMRTKGRVDNFHGYRNKSLNAERREREQLRISVENKNILRRILSRQPVYSHRTWVDDWNKNRVLQNNISHYPNKWWKSSKYNKGTPRDSVTGKMGGGTVMSRKDDDEYSQDYESEEVEGDTAAVNTSQSSEVKTKEEKHKMVEGKKEEKNEGKDSVTKKEDEKKQEEHLEEKETAGNNEIKREQENMVNASPENPEDSETGAKQSS